MRFIRVTGRKYIGLMLAASLIFGAIPGAAFADQEPSVLINGGFEHPGLSATGVYQWWTNYTPSGGSEDQFGWKTTNSDSLYEFGGDWNINGWGIGFIPEGRQFIELNADQQAAVYQNLSTTPGTVIYWSLYQGGVWYSKNIDDIDNTLAVRIGTADQLSSDIITSSGLTDYDQAWSNRAIYEMDKKSEVDSVPEAYADKGNDKKKLYTEPKRWTRYEGVYVVPEGQTVTRFAFASLSQIPTQGNLLDGVVFRLATQEEAGDLDVTPPVIGPATGNPESWTTGEQIISFDVSDNKGDISSVTVNGSQSEEKTVSNAGSTYSFTATQNETYTITATDAANNTSVSQIVVEYIVPELIDSQKLAAAKTAIETALSSLNINNATEADNILAAAVAASLHGATVAWDEAEGFSKISATSSAQGSVTGKLSLTLKGEHDVISISRVIEKLPSPGTGSGGGSSSGGSSSGGSTSEPTQQEDEVTVIVNGKEHSAGKETMTVEGGKTAVTVELNNKVIESKIDEAIRNNTNGTGNVITVQVADTKAGISKIELTGDIVRRLESNAFDVSIKRDDIEYVIPAEEFTINRAAENLGVAENDFQDIRIEVRIEKLDEKTSEEYRKSVRENGAELIFSPVSFEIVAKTTDKYGKTKDFTISKFSDYVERIMEIPAGIDKNRITTGIVFNSDGTYSHVPTSVFEKDGRWYARVNSLTNSDYSVIYNAVTVESAEKHWAKDTINDMASRMVLIRPESFEPDKFINRADFAEYIVRALGIYREDSIYENKFNDLNGDKSQTQAILTASEYGIVAGYPDGTFRPEALITRQEAMAMYQRVMKVTNLTGNNPERYKNYKDFADVNDWAKSDVKEVLSAHVFNGTSETAILPKSNLTCAEALQAIKNLLVESQLINK